MYFPCGKCPECLKRRVSGWSFRLLQEEKNSASALFLTLTYSTDTVPISDNGFMTLKKRDVQLFMKRLRKYHKLVKLKYYVVGEYGGKTNRPHYHMILFNANIKYVQDSWKNGQIHYGEVSGASVGYTLKYMMKQGKIPMHRNDDRVKEFSLMSKGLGANYLSPQMKYWHIRDLENRMHCVLKDGRKIAMPRYYKDKVYNETQRKVIALKAKVDAEIRMKDHIDEMRKIHGENWLHIEIQSHNYQFQKMYKHAENNRNTI